MALRDLKERHTKANFLLSHHTSSIVSIKIILRLRMSVIMAVNNISSVFVPDNFSFETVFDHVLSDILCIKCWIRLKCCPRNDSLALKCIQLCSARPMSSCCAFFKQTIDVNFGTNQNIAVVTVWWFRRFCNDT